MGGHATLVGGRRSATPYRVGRVLRAMRARPIAIIDDDAAMRAAVSDLLRSVGYTVSLFNSADDFLARADLGLFAGVIADVQMPGMTGFDLARALAEHASSLPLILITALTDARLHYQAPDAGAVALLRKPFDPTVLLAHIERSFGSNQ